jgi:DNA-binding NtrC family response regulator
VTEPRRLGWKNFTSLAPKAGRILIVEDNHEVRKVMERVVASLGHEVRGAASAEQADHWLGAERFDVMLLDVELPRMKGVEFLGWALDRDPELAVIMLTGLDDPALAIQCIERGARTYLVKPVETEFLRLALRDALAVRKLLQDRNAQL